MRPASRSTGFIRFAKRKPTDCTETCEELARNYSRSKSHKWNLDLAEETRANSPSYDYDLNILATYFQEVRVREFEIGSKSFSI